MEENRKRIEQERGLGAFRSLGGGGGGGGPNWSATFLYWNRRGPSKSASFLGYWPR